MNKSFYFLVLVLVVCGLRAQPAAVQADPTTGALFRPVAATFISGNSLLTTTAAAAAYQPLDADLTAIAALSGTGLLTRTAANTWTTRTLTGTTAEITVTNGDGVSGVPTFSLPASLTFTGKTITGGTYSSPTLTTPNIGAATGTSVGLSTTYPFYRWTATGNTTDKKVFDIVAGVVDDRLEFRALGDALSGPTMVYINGHSLLTGQFGVPITTQATTTSDGALYTAGGLSVVKNAVVGGNITVSGTGTSSVSGPWKLAAYIVSGLPAASSNAGALAYVTDASATTRLATVSGGGSNKVIVFSDGTNWLIL